MALRRTIDERPDLMAARGGLSPEERLLLDLPGSAPPRRSPPDPGSPPPRPDRPDTPLEVDGPADGPFPA
jgi:hypothetical protein